MFNSFEIRAGFASTKNICSVYFNGAYPSHHCAVGSGRCAESSTPRTIIRNYRQEGWQACTLCVPRVAKRSKHTQEPRRPSTEKVARSSYDLLLNTGQSSSLLMAETRREQHPSKFCKKSAQQPRSYAHQAIKSCYSPPKKREDKSKKETYDDHKSLRSRTRQTTHQTAKPTTITIASA